MDSIKPVGVGFIYIPIKQNTVHGLSSKYWVIKTERLSSFQQNPACTIKYHRAPNRVLCRDLLARITALKDLSLASQTKNRCKKLHFMA